MKISNITAALLLCSGLVFTGCGSDDSGDSASPSTGDGSTAVSGVAVDGYLRNAFVCVDTNNNGECDDGEPYSKTSSDGNYSLSYTADEGSGATLLVVGGVDDGTGENFYGLLKAPLDGSESTINITPLTTMVAAQIAQNGGSNSDSTAIAAATANVANTLGLTSDQVHSDPVGDGNETVLKKALQIQKVIEILAAAEVESGSSVADAMKNVSEILAKQLDGTESNITALVTAAAADAEGNLTIAGDGDIIELANAVVENLEDATGDLETIANELVTDAVTAVDSAVSLDDAGEPVVATSTLNTATTNAAVVLTSSDILGLDVDRLLDIIGYPITDGDANKTALIADINASGNFNPNSGTTITEFQTYLNADTDLDADFKVILLTSIELSLVIESTLGGSEDVANIEDTAFIEYRLEKNNGVNSYQVSSHTLNSTGNTLDGVRYLYSVTNSNWVSQLDGSRDENAYYLWNGTAFVEADYANQTYVIEESVANIQNSDGVVTTSVALLGVNDLAGVNKTIVAQNERDSSSSEQVDVNFTEGKEYILELTEKARVGVSTGYAMSIYSNTGGEDTNFTSYTEFLNALDNNQSVYYDDGKQLRFKGTYTSQTQGVLAEDTVNDNNDVTSTQEDFATWKIETINGLEVFTVRENSNGRNIFAAVLKDGTVYRGDVQEQREQILIAYSQEAIDEILSTKSLPAIDSTTIVDGTNYQLVSSEIDRFMPTYESPSTNESNSTYTKFIWSTDFFLDGAFAQGSVGILTNINSDTSELNVTMALDSSGVPTTATTTGEVDNNISYSSVATFMNGYIDFIVTTIDGTSVKTDAYGNIQ